MRRLPFAFSALLGLISFLIVLHFFLYPEPIFEASLRGLKIWWDIVFPALLPFFIVSELMIGIGLAHFFGVLLEPIMRPLFNVPGAGAFALTMGFASGYPVGAKLTVRLREHQMITKSEGERLVSFVSTSDPLFMTGAVAIGFFHNATLGILLASVHYVSSILIGIGMRFHDRHGTRTEHKVEGQTIYKRALKAMHHARIEDNRAFGKLMGDAVSSSLQTLLLVGGLIIIFSVMITIFTYMQITSLLAHFFALLLTILGLSVELNQALISGLFEVTLGTKGASIGNESIAIVDQIAIASAILAWGGLSVHAQVASILSTTDIRYKPYLLARIIHAFVAAFLTYFAWALWKYIPIDMPVSFATIPEAKSWQTWSGVFLLLIRVGVFLGGISVLAMALVLLQRLKSWLWR